MASQVPLKITYPYQLTTRVGTITLNVDPGWQVPDEAVCLVPVEEQGLVLALMEMVVNDVATRKVVRITEELCGTEFSKSTVSDLYKQLDPVVFVWSAR
ncbi:hypothetical protein JIR001_18970 [Polycladomyces abyssicola]|uniref:Uncharacterized protein n=1 Tax=Polycladomyces abyssicola TaxID=1125966 RepID=A0A8D5UFE9_9BACL|nr:hypothetical protein JIR001_18970 [Polycladomyces abyssicola]